MVCTMKKLKFGSIEILGCIGVIVWVAVIILRVSPLPNNSVILFLIGILPNLGAAWATTMFGKWIIVFVCKQNYSIKKHCILCAGIFAISLVSEFINDLFFASPFDFNDILVTIAAQFVIFLSPIVFKDKYFKNYD